MSPSSEPDLDLVGGAGNTPACGQVAEVVVTAHSPVTRSYPAAGVPGGFMSAGPVPGLVEQHLTLEPVGIDEEQAEGDAEVGDEPVGRPAMRSAARWISSNASCDAACNPMWSMCPLLEHGGLVFGLGVAGQLEHVELRVRSDGHERQPALAARRR